MDADKYFELQEKAIKENKESYKIRDGVRYINVTECDSMHWNATAIMETLCDDFRDMETGLEYLRFSTFAKFICKIFTKNEFDKADKKIKDWIIRNNRKLFNKADREFNKMIRNNYVFYCKLKHDVYYT